MKLNVFYVVYITRSFISTFAASIFERNDYLEILDIRVRRVGQCMEEQFVTSLLKNVCILSCSFSSRGIHFYNSTFETVANFLLDFRITKVE